MVRYYSCCDSTIYGSWYDTARIRVGCIIGRWRCDWTDYGGTSGIFKLEGVISYWPRGPPLLFWFQLSQAYFRNPWASPGGGSPRTIWQGHHRPLHKWPLLKFAPGRNVMLLTVLDCPVVSQCFQTVPLSHHLLVRPSVRDARVWPFKR